MKHLRFITVLLGIIVVFVIGVVLYQLSSVLLPFVIAVLLSFIFKPLLISLEHRRVPRAIALLLVMVIVAGVLFLLSMIVYTSVESLAANLPAYQERLASLGSRLDVLVQSIGERFGSEAVKFNPADVIKLSTITAVAAASVGTFITFFSNAFLVILFMLFLLGGTGDLRAKVIHAFSEGQAERIATIIESIDLRVRKYLVMKTLINISVGLTTTVILMIFDVDFAVFWGLLTFLLSYIPNFGSVIATIFPVLIALLKFDSLLRALLVLVLLIVSQNILGNVVEPKLMQFSLNLSPVLILLALIFWGWLWGVLGMILAVPITSTLKIVCENVATLRPIAVLMSGRITEGAKSRKVKLIVVPETGS